MASIRAIPKQLASRGGIPRDIREEIPKAKTEFDEASYPLA